jgi:tRNA G18 (ribose-2'-O)-methylase SpoU
MARSLNNLRQIVLIAHNFRSTHNVGSLFRTAEGLGVNELILSGYTPYPKEENDNRLPYMADKLEKQINKAALGAQFSLKWRHTEDIAKPIGVYKDQGFKVIALEQDKNSHVITDLDYGDNIVLIVGNELIGLTTDVLGLCDQIIEIPMYGRKESYNVVQAAAMALFYLRLSSS